MSKKLICRLHFEVGKLTMIKQILPQLEKKNIYVCIHGQAACWRFDPAQAKLAPRLSDQTRSMKLPPAACFVFFSSPTRLGEIALMGELHVGSIL